MEATANNADLFSRSDLDLTEYTSTGLCSYPAYKNLIDACTRYVLLHSFNAHDVANHCMGCRNRQFQDCHNCYCCGWCEKKLRRINQPCSLECRGFFLDNETQNLYPRLGQMQIVICLKNFFHALGYY